MRISTSLVPALLLGLLVAPRAQAQEPPMDAAALAHALDRLARTGRVLYVAAHPDDENTRLLAYLANGLHLGATYLSMTRGGGGQNLIGAEQSELLDVIRTQELLAARRLDGAEQRFTRMRDFGYSKSAEETLATWGHDEALADVVWVIRTVQPDVIITRFDERPPNHGHHTASAILAREAFAAAADPTRFPEQLARGATVWKTERLLHNVTPWREGPPPTGAVTLDVGAYDARLGLSYGELAARSRSQHQSQGFGVPGERGSLIERFVLVAGSPVKAELFEGLDLSWGRYGPRAAKLTAALAEAQRTLERDHPERALPALLAAHRALDALPDDVRTRHARGALDTLIASAAGLFVRATAARPVTTPGATLPVKVELVLGRPAGLAVERLELPYGVRSAPPALVTGQKVELTADVVVPADAPISTPPWLATPPTTDAEARPSARHEVRSPELVGEPEGPPPLAVTVVLRLEDRTLTRTIPVLYGWTDRVQGERLRHVMIVPPATVTPTREAVMFPGGRPNTLAVVVRAGRDGVEGEVSVPLPAGWKSTPPRAKVALAKAGDEATVQLELTPPAATAAPLVLAPELEVAGRRWSYRQDTVDHPHIPVQVVLQPARVRLVPLALVLPPGLIGYLPGSGDTIASDLAHVGAKVELLDDERLERGELSRYSVVVLGIRAYNTRPVLRRAHARLMRYVEQGGTVIVQYNTNSRWDALDMPLGPYALEVGRERVTDETAALVPVDPRARVLTTPNRLGPADDAGWVQERGLYFASKYAPEYKPVFRVADPGEKPQEGSLIIARHGKGHHVYTGLAFFRQLPAGVPGAYRLLANLLGVGGR